MRTDARAELIEGHLPLVRAVARRYAGLGEPLEDLVQVGTIGLIKAVDRYDTRRATPLGAYAASCITGEIRHHLRDRSAPVRVPRRLQEEGVRVTAATLDSVADVVDPVVAADERLTLGAALRSLHAGEREVVRLRFVEDLSQAEIAERTGVSQVHVSRTLRRALDRLRQLLGATPTGNQTADVAVGNPLP